MSIYHSGLVFPEGPVLLDDGGLLCVEMVPNAGQVVHIAPDGLSKRVLAVTGRPNGLAMDEHQNIWVAESARRALLKMDLDGRYEVFADRCGDEHFLFPNDVTVGPDGAIYMTDSGALVDDLAPDGEVNPDWYKVPFDGKIVRVDPQSGDVTCLTRGLQFANGLAFSPAGELYGNETMSGEIFRVESDGSRTVVANVVDTPRAADEVKGPDGMKFAADGRSLHAVFGQGNIAVLDTSGAIIQRIPVQGTHPTNLAIGKEGEIFVTEVSTGSIQRIEIDA